MIKDAAFDLLSKTVSIKIYIIVVLFYSGLGYYFSRSCKGKLAELMENKKNRKWLFVCWVYGLLLLTIFFFIPNLPPARGCVLVLLYILLLIETIYSVHHIEWPASRFLKQYENALQEGKIYEAMEQFSVRPWYLTEPEEKAIYHLKRAHNYVLVGKYIQAYELFEKTDICYLYPDQRREVNRQKANCLYLMGALGKAEYLLELDQNEIMVKDEIGRGGMRGINEKNGSAMNFMLRGLIQMEKGNYPEARKLLQTALNCADIRRLDKVYLVSIYINLGVNVSVRNPQEAAEYFEQARYSAREIHSVEAVHAVYNNLIHTYIRLGCGEEQIQRILKEYTSSFTQDTIQGRLELSNLRINLARERKNITAVREEIDQSYRELLDCAGNDISARAGIEISTWRMAVNAHMPLKYLGAYAEQILTDIPRYQKLELMEKLNAYRELVIPFTSIYIEQQKCGGTKQAVLMSEVEPFASLTRIILDYYRTFAQDEISEQMNRLKEIQVNERRALVEHLLHVYRMVKPDCYLEELHQRFTSEIKRARDDGNFLKVVDYEIKRIDAFSGPENLDKNNKPQNEGEIHRWLDQCIVDIAKVEMSPAIAEHYLNLALRLAFMGRFKEAEIWRDKFDSLHISTMHFTELLQQQKSALDILLTENHNHSPDIITSKL